MIRTLPMMLVAAAMVLSIATVSTAQARSGDHFDRPQFKEPFGEIRWDHAGTKQKAATESSVATDAIDQLAENFGIKRRPHTPN